MVAPSTVSVGRHLKNHSAAVLVYPADLRPIAAVICRAEHVAVTIPDGWGPRTAAIRAVLLTAKAVELGVDPPAGARRQFADRARSVIISGAHLAVQIANAVDKEARPRAISVDTRVAPPSAPRTQLENPTAAQPIVADERAVKVPHAVED